LIGAIALGALLACPRPGAAGVRLELRGGYHSPSEQAFRDIYGGGPAYGADVVVGLLKNVDLWAGGGYFYRKGLLTFTAEETFVKIRTLGWGIRYRRAVGRFDVHGGAALNFYLYDESNPIGDVEAGKIGPEVRAGAFYRFTDRASAGAFASWSTCTIAPAQYEVDIGGLTAGLALSYRFGRLTPSPPPAKTPPTPLK